MYVRAKFALLVLLGACSVGEVPVGGGPDGGSGMDMNNGTGGGQSFNAMIKPLVDPKCTGCHSAGTPPTLSSFSALQPKYKMKPGSSNILVTKGDHAGITYFTDAQKKTVSDWIDSLP